MHGAHGPVPCLARRVRKMRQPAARLHGCGCERLLELRAAPSVFFHIVTREAESRRAKMVAEKSDLPGGPREQRAREREQRASGPQTDRIRQRGAGGQRDRKTGEQRECEGDRNGGSEAGAVCSVLRPVRAAGMRGEPPAALEGGGSAVGGGGHEARRRHDRRHARVVQPLEAPRRSSLPPPSPQAQARLFPQRIDTGRCRGAFLPQARK